MAKKEPIENDYSDSFFDIALKRSHPDSYTNHYIVCEETEEGNLYKYYNSEDVLFYTVLKYKLKTTPEEERPYRRRGAV